MRGLSVSAENSKRVERVAQRRRTAIPREDLRIVVFPEQGGNAREWRFQQKHRAWLSIIGVGAALAVSAVVYLVLSAQQNVVAIRHLRQELTSNERIQTQNRQLRAELSAVKSQERTGNERAIAQVSEMVRDIHHVQGELGVPLSPSGEGVGNLLSRLDSMQKELPGLLSAAVTRDTFLRFKPDELPVQGPVVSPFGWRVNPLGGNGAEFHDGIDIAVPPGTPVCAPAAGVVTYAGWYAGYGEYVQIDHGYGIETFYGHNSKILLHLGEHVVRGQEISLSGDTGNSTGPHVHFGLHYRGLPTNPWTFIHSNPPAIN